MKQTLLKTVALVAAVTVAAIGLVLGSGYSTASQDGKLRVVASFYPVYVITLNLTDGVENVAVSSLAAPAGGCLHDYQLSPIDLVTLQNADLFIVNGAGAEPFLDPVRQRYPDLPLADSSVGIPLLCPSHTHGHTHEEHEHTAESEYNAHIWTDPVRYAQQVNNVCAALCATDPARADRYRQNADAYLAKIRAVEARLRTAAASLPATVGAVLFHDSLTYLADFLGLQVLSVLPVGEDEGVSAAALAEAATAVRNAESVLFLYDDQYRDLQYRYLQEEASASATLFLNTAAGGARSADGWLSAMYQIASALEEVSL